MLLLGLSCSCHKNSAIEYSDRADGALTPYSSTIIVTKSKITNSRVTYIDGENKDDNFISRFYLEKLNIQWKTSMEEESADYTQSIRVKMASNDLPDVFIVDKTQLYSLVKQDMVWNLTDIYETYATDLLKKNIEYGNKTVLKYAQINDSIYGIPLMTSYESKVGFMYIRTDWLKKLSLDVPQTYHELVHVLAEFKANKLTKGLTTTDTPFLFEGTGSYSFNSIAQTSGAYYDFWISDRTKNGLVYSSIQQNMKNALIKMKDLYQSGLIDKAFAVMSTNVWEDLLAKGQYGVVFGQYFYPHILKENVMNDGTAEWGAYPIPFDDNGGLKPAKGNFVDSYVVVRKDYEHPEALIKSMNLWLEIWSSAGMYRDWFIEQMTNKYKDIYLCGEYALPYFYDYAINNINIGHGIREIFASTNPSEAVKIQSESTRFSYNFMKDESSPTYVSGEGWALKHIYTGSEKVFDENYDAFQTDLFQGFFTESDYRLKETLDAYLSIEFEKIIMGAPIENFDAIVAEWERKGGTLLTQKVNSWYSGQTKTK